MSTFNVALKNGKQLAIPAEYYPRYAEIVATKENLFCLSPISRWEVFFKAIGQHIFNPVFAVLSIINLGLCTPLLVRNYPNNQEAIYYTYLSTGFIFSYFITKLYMGVMKKDPISIHGVAERLS